MNQNIKQLVNQVCEQNNLPFTPEHNKAYVLDNFAEQLAELIIQKCIGLCADVEVDDELSNHEYEGGLADGAILCQQEIKEYFGVK
jgi:predicted Rdx family selenoprotein